MSRSPRFTRELWSHIGVIFEAILAHPFIQGLTDGSLPRAAFRFYVVQDALYLREFARALSIAAAKAPEDGDIAMFNTHAAEAIQVERQLHEGFFKAFRPKGRPRYRDGADHPGLHELPAVRFLRPPLSRRVSGPPAVLLDIQGGR